MDNFDKVYGLDIQQIPFTPDEQKPIRHNTRMGVIWGVPVQIVREGHWAGVWRVVRIWHESDRQPMEHLVGYVRFDLEDLTVHIRRKWDEREIDASLSFRGNRSIPFCLQRACESLLIDHAIGHILDAKAQKA